jgi:hypothetical protein
MSTYTLTGSGVQTLNAGVGQLHVHINVLPARAGSGNANPVNFYHVGFLRPADATAFWAPIPIEATDDWIGLPNGTTRLGYALEPSGSIDVVEVFLPNPFTGPVGAIGPTGPSGGSFAVSTQVAHLGANVTLTPVNTFVDAVTLTIGVGTWLLFGHVAHHDTGGGSTQTSRLYDGTVGLAEADVGLSNSFDGNTSVSAVYVVASGTKTIHLQGATQSAGRMDKSTITNSSGNFATYLIAVRVA